MNLRIPVIALLAVASSVLWMAAATASATDLTYAPNPAELPVSVYTSTIAAASEGHVTLNNPIAKVECASTLEGKVESHGAGVTVKGNVSTLSFSSCTNSWHVTTVSAGSLEVHETGTGDGTLTSSGATVEATRLGVTCRYATSSTAIGTLTGSFTTGTNATIDLSGSIPFHSGSGLCGAGAVGWTGSYVVTTPSLLAVQQQDPVPSLKFGTPNAGKFKPSESIEWEVIDVNSPVEWTLEKVALGVTKGTWSMPEPGTCGNKKVEKEKGEKKVCKVIVECIAAGEARFEAFISWKDAKGVLQKRIGPSRMTCA